MTAKIFAIADVHVGNHSQHGGTLTAGINVRCRMILDVLSGVIDHVAAKDGVLLVCGDLINEIRPEAPILAALQECFARVPTIIIKGNHDSNSDAPGDHALGPLAPVATIVEVPSVFELDGVTLWCIPFRNQPATEWLEAAFRECARQDTTVGVPRVAALHLGIADDKTAVFLQGKPDSIAAKTLFELCRRHKVRHVYAGNWHDQREWTNGVNGDITLHQLGALVPTGWNNPGLDGYGGLGVWEPTYAPLLYQLDGPRFVKALLSSEVDDLLKLDEAARARIYLRAYTEPEKVSALADELSTQGFAAVEVLAHGVYRQLAVNSAAAVATSANTIDEAVGSYVMQTPLPKDVTFENPADERAYRERVLQHTRDCLVEGLTGVQQ